MARKPADQSVSREDIIRAAADVLRDNGYEATTMKDIAAQVNLTAASLYHHFRNKDFLILAVLERGLNGAIESIEPVVESTMSNADKLRRMVAIHIEALTGNPTVGAAMVLELKSLKDAVLSGNDKELKEEYVKRRDAYFNRRDYFEKLFRDTIKQGMASGEFRQVDASIVAKAMLGAQNWVGVWYKPGGRLDGDGIAEIIADTFLASLVQK